jgi:hypothetical protein
MLVHGVDLSDWPGGFGSAALSEQGVTATVAAFRESLRLLKREGDLGR